MLNSRRREKIQARLGSSPLPKMQKGRRVLKKQRVDSNILLTSHHCPLDTHLQHRPELDSSGRDEGTFCPVVCCPDTATLITVSPSDLTLVFLLGARCLAQSPGPLDEGTAAVFTLLPTAGVLEGPFYSEGLSQRLCECQGLYLK